MSPINECPQTQARHKLISAHVPSVHRNHWIFSAVSATAVAVATMATESPSQGTNKENLVHIKRFKKEQGTKKMVVMGMGMQYALSLIHI